MSTRGPRGLFRYPLPSTVSTIFQYIPFAILTFFVPNADADIVCARAKNHYDPQAGLDFSDSATQMDDSQAGKNLEAFKRNFKSLHANTALSMYFS